MTPKEIEDLIGRLEDRTLLHIPAGGRAERISDEDGNAAAAALRQLLAERQWRPIDTLPDHLKDGRTILIGGGLDRGLPWSDAAFWHDGSLCHPGRGKAGLFAESDRGNLLTAKNVTCEVFMELPLPSHTEDVR